MGISYSKMKIKSYEFGRILIDEKEYRNDVIIFEDYVKGDWWRKDGHRLQVDDLKEIVKRTPELLIVGTGYSGIMVVPKDIEDYLNSLGIELKVMNTRKAVDLYNKISGEKKVVAALHLTC